MWNNENLRRVSLPTSHDRPTHTRSRTRKLIPRHNKRRFFSEYKLRRLITSLTRRLHIIGRQNLLTPVGVSPFSPARELLFLARALFFALSRAPKWSAIKRKPLPSWKVPRKSTDVFSAFSVTSVSSLVSSFPLLPLLLFRKFDFFVLLHLKNLNARIPSTFPLYRCSLRTIGLGRPIHHVTTRRWRPTQGYLTYKEFKSRKTVKLPFYHSSYTSFDIAIYTPLNVSIKNSALAKHRPSLRLSSILSHIPECQSLRTHLHTER